MPDEKIVSYILVNRESVIGKVLYWKYGQMGGWTEDLKDARRFAREASANASRRTLSKRPGMAPEFFKIEAITE